MEYWGLGNRCRDAAVYQCIHSAARVFSRGTLFHGYREGIAGIGLFRAMRPEEVALNECEKFSINIPVTCSDSDQITAPFFRQR